MKNLWIRSNVNPGGKKAANLPALKLLACLAKKINSAMVRMKETCSSPSYRVEKQCQLFPLGRLRRFSLVVLEVVLGWLLLLPFGGVRVAPGQKRLIMIIALASHVLVESALARFSSRMPKAV